MSGPYDDIINLPHHVSATRPRMPVETRAAQFAPFAALTGYDAAVREAARSTEERIELAEGATAAMDAKLRILSDALADRPEVAVTFFRPDERKKGGAYVTAVGELLAIDGCERVVLLADGSRIAIRDILEIECGLFGEDPA